jgi:monofunctional biosynthetic peptidoglycan transglycosylase
MAERARSRSGSGSGSRSGSRSRSGRTPVKPRRRGWRRVGVVALVLVGALALASLAVYCTLPDVRPLARTNPTSTAFIDLRREAAAAAGEKLELRWTWKPLAKISPYLRNAVVHSEDPRFWDHDGIDWDAVEKAAKADLAAREMKYGASTITQQVAKNLYLSPSKNPLRKLREWMIAGRLEDHLSKDRILEIYLNIAEWGDGVFGAEAAARRWYGVSAAALTPVQAARLAVALPNPRKRAPNVRNAQLSTKASRLVAAMRRDGVIDEAAFDAALVELGIKRPPKPAVEAEAVEAETPRTPEAAPTPEVVPTPEEPSPPAEAPPAEAPPAEPADAAP